MKPTSSDDSLPTGAARLGETRSSSTAQAHADPDVGRPFPAPPLEHPAGNREAPEPASPGRSRSAPPGGRERQRPWGPSSTAQSRSGRRTMLLILFACALPVLASYFTYYVVQPKGRANYATLVEPQRPLPDLATVPAQDLEGRPVSLTTLKGQWLLVVVGPAECGKACEDNLFLERQLREMMGAERERIDKVWLVDSPGPLAPAVAAAVAAKPSVATYRVDRAALSRWLVPEDGHRLEEHLYIVDPLGNWMMRTPAHPDPIRLKKDVDRLLRASAWWNRPRDAR